MTREEQLVFCKRCEHQKIDLKQGIICSITNKLADFEETCPSFVEDEARVSYFESIEKSRPVVQKEAGTGKRFLNYLIDLVCLYLFSMMFGFVLAIVLSLMAPGALSFLDNPNILLNYLIGIIFGTLYYVILEGSTGRTIGKLITQTKVVDNEGHKPGLTKILKRSVCRFIPFEPFSFLGSSSRGWHDSLSDTRVVKVEKN